MLAWLIIILLLAFIGWQGYKLYVDFKKNKKKKDVSLNDLEFSDEEKKD